MRVLLRDPVLPQHAPVPTNDAERIVFSHLYVGLTALSPDGSVLPMLAERISQRTDVLWDIRLRSDLRFSDGTSLRAVDVAKGWVLAAERCPDRGVWTHFDPLLVRAQGFRDLLVRTPEPEVDLPRLLADPAFAVMSFLTRETLPVGAGPLAIVDGRVRLGDTVAEPNPYFAGPAPVDAVSWRLPPSEDAPRRMISSGTLPGEESVSSLASDEIPRRAVALHLDPAADPRDVADARPSVEALLVRDEESIRFLQSAGYAAKPLPYDRGYVLFLSGPTPVGLDRQELADLTVMEDARPWTGVEVTELETAAPQIGEVIVLLASESPGESADTAATEDEESRPPPIYPTGRPERDPSPVGFGDVETAALADAARIGTRLAALWSADVVVRTDQDPHQPLRPGQAVVIPVDRSRAVANLSSLTLRWLNIEGDDEITILSLLESRAQLLGSPGLSGVRVDGLGVPRFENAARSRTVGSSSTVP